MKARLIPVFFEPGRDEEFDRQLARLRDQLAGEAELLPPTALGSALPRAEAVVFPQLPGQAYQRIEDLTRIDLPLMVLTSEFGTINMWDWEIVNFLKLHGLTTFAPYDLDLTRAICRMLGVKRQMRRTKFVVIQDKPGEEGHQADIFRRMYCYQERCVADLESKFGVRIESLSFKEFGAKTKSIPDARAREYLDLEGWPAEEVGQKALLAAQKFYLALKDLLAADPDIGAVGINCLNESFYSDSTPCLAFCRLFEEEGLIWGCEADLVSMATEYIIHKSLKAPFMMSNVYPFLMGMAALKHERIESFPDIEEPENHILVAHCGYFGLTPKCFCTDWTLRPKALAIVEETATAVDAWLPKGDLTLAKLDQSFNRLQVIKAELKDYVQYPGSDCRNGGILKVRDGRRMMHSFYSHHNILIPGRWEEEMINLAKVFDLKLEEY